MVRNHQGARDIERALRDEEEMLTRGCFDAVQVQNRAINFLFLLLFWQETTEIGPHPLIKRPIRLRWRSSCFNSLGVFTHFAKSYTSLHSSHKLTSLWSDLLIISSEDAKHPPRSNLYLIPCPFE